MVENNDADSTTNKSNSTASTLELSNDFVGTETAGPYSIVVPGKVQDVMETFQDVVWDELGMQSSIILNALTSCKIVDKGNNDGVGRTRQIGGFVEEKILLVVPEERYEYTVTKGLPASFHRGCVQFTQLPDDDNTSTSTDGATSTRVDWIVNFTPYRCMNNTIRFSVWLTFPIFLRSLKQECEKKNNKKETTTSTSTASSK